MHPQTYLRTFWRSEFESKIFVAMSFDEAYKSRFENIFTPAIKNIRIGGVPLEAVRVDISKTGDSILTEIMDGISHSQMVLADVSSIGRDAVTGQPYRNANVMYEVGVALACRQSSEVLLVRDDKDKFLFDVSVVPHLQINFSNPAEATKKITDELIARLQERNFLNDARARIALESLSIDEIKLIKGIPAEDLKTVWAWNDPGHVDFLQIVAVPRLLDKRIIRLVGQSKDGPPAYELTPIGLSIKKHIKSGLKSFEMEQSPEPSKSERPS